MVLAGLVLLSCVAQAQVPQVISYEGRVAVGGVNFDSATAGHAGLFKFALVSPDGTATYWSNDGTSVAGSAPTAAVSLTVTKGLYSVLLGDTAAPLSMSPISAAVFAHPDVRLRVWFDDGTHGLQLLSPDRRIASVAYAVVASEVADGSVSAAKIAAGAVGSAQLAANAVQTANLAAGAVDNTKLANVAVTVTAGAGLAGGGVVSLGGGVTLGIPNGGVGAAQLAAGAAAANLGSTATPTFAGATILNAGTGSNKPALILDRGIPPLVENEGTGPKGRLTLQRNSLDPVWSGLVMSVNANWSDVNGYVTDDPNRSVSIFQMEYEYLDGRGFLLNEINWTVNGYRVLQFATDVQTPSRSIIQLNGVTGVGFQVANPAALEDTSGRIFTATAARDNSDIAVWIANYSNSSLGSGLILASRNTTNQMSTHAPDWVNLWSLSADPRGAGTNEFGIRDVSAGVYRFLINQAGNVGIKGNINPQYALDVNGDVNVTGTFRVNGIVQVTPKQGLSRLAVELPSLNATTQTVALAPNCFTPAVLVAEGSNVLKMMSLDPTAWKGRSVKVGMLVAVDGTSGQDIACRLMISYTTKTLDGTDNTVVFPDPAFAETSLPDANYLTTAAPTVVGGVKWIESAPITIPNDVTALAANFELAKAQAGDTNTDTGYIIETRVTEQ